MAGSVGMRGDLSALMLIAAAAFGASCRTSESADENDVKVEVAAGSEHLDAASVELDRKREQLLSAQASLERQRKGLEAGATGSPEQIKAKQLVTQKEVERVKADQQKVSSQLRALEAERKKIARQSAKVSETLKVIEGEDTMTQLETVVALKERAVADREAKSQDDTAGVIKSLGQVSRQIEIAIGRVKVAMGRPAPDAGAKAAKKGKGGRSR